MSLACARSCTHACTLTAGCGRRLYGLPLEKVGRRFLRLTPLDAAGVTSGARVHYLQWVVTRTGGTRVVHLQSLLRLHNATQRPLVVRVARRVSNDAAPAGAPSHQETVTMLPDQVWHTPVYLASDCELAVRPATLMSDMGGQGAGAGAGAGAGSPGHTGAVVPVADLEGGCQFENNVSDATDCLGSYAADARYTWSYPLDSKTRGHGDVHPSSSGGTGLPITEIDFDAHPTHVLACSAAGSAALPDPEHHCFVYLEVGCCMVNGGGCTPPVELMCVCVCWTRCAG